MSHPWNAIFFVLVNAQHKFDVNPFTGLLHSVKSEDQKLVPPRQDFAVLEALEAISLQQGQSWHGLKRAEKSLQKTEGELWVSVIPAYHLLCGQCHLERKGGWWGGILFLFWWSPSVGWMWLKCACGLGIMLKREEGMWYEPSFKSIALPEPKMGLTSSPNHLVCRARRRCLCSSRSSVPSCPTSSIVLLSIWLRLLDLDGGLQKEPVHWGTIWNKRRTFQYSQYFWANEKCLFVSQASYNYTKIYCSNKTVTGVLKDVLWYNCRAIICMLKLKDFTSVVICFLCLGISFQAALHKGCQVAS